MSVSVCDPDRKFSYKDYLTWSEDERWELIDGVPYNMTPVPSRKHQEILSELSAEFAMYLRDKSCRVYPGVKEY